MPIYEIECRDCRTTQEIIVMESAAALCCPACGSSRVERLMSATSSLTGRGNTGCCGSSPAHAGCAGPGSCCGKTR